MKKFHFLIFICIVVCAVSAFALVGCDNKALPAPFGLDFDGPTLTLSWKADDNARYYMVSISGNGVNETKNTRKNSFSFSSMDLPEGDYTLKVKACGDGKDHKDSAWSKPVVFAQDADTGLTFRFLNNNSEAEVSGLGRATGRVVIPDKYRGIPVTRIGDHAFSGKSKLTGIVMCDGIVAVGANAFYNCASLEEVVFSSNLKEIGDKAFQSCRMLPDDLIIPDSVEKIGDNAFAYCTALKNVKLGKNLQTLGINAFAYCTELLSVQFSDGIETIGDSAFFSCKKLNTVKFGAKLQSIGEFAFASCESLAAVSLGRGVKELGQYAFAKCYGLETVELSDTVETIGEYAFYDDTALSEVNVGAGVKKIGKGAFVNTALWENSQNDVYVGNWFVGCKSTEVSALQIKEGAVGIANSAVSGFAKLTSITLPDTVKIIGDGAFAGSKITAVVIGSGVEEIGVQAFYKCEMLTNAILGAYDFTNHQLTDSSLKVINAYAFMDCTRLESIEIPSSVEVISSYAFNNAALYKNASNGVAYAGNWVVGCDAKRASGEIVIEDGTVGIANYAFYKCNAVTSVRLPESVKTIGRSAFYQCTELTSVNLPSELENIEDYTFYGCGKLALPALPQTLKSIGRSAFYKCALSNASGEDTDNDVLTIPDSVESIGDYAFFGCGYTSYNVDEAGNFILSKGGIDVVVLGAGVKHIGANAFNTIHTLKRVVFGENVETMGAKAFYGCDALEEVVFNDGLQTIGARAFYGCNGLERIELPSGLTTIDDYAFYRCAGLKEIVFGANVQTIGDFAFYGCALLTSLDLPSGVTSIGKQAFRACTGLQSVVLRDTVTYIDAHAFYGCKSLTIYAQDAQPKEDWNARFNSSYRPVVWGCVLKDGYVYSVTKNDKTLSNINTVNTFAAPQREGYVFAGWSKVENASAAEFAADKITDVSNGTKLFAVWVADN